MQTAKIERNKHAPTPPAVYSIGQLAEVLSCSAKHLSRLHESGRLPKPVKIGSLTRWVAADITRWISEGCPPVTEQKQATAA